MDIKIKNKFENIKQIIFVLLLALWMIIPILKDLRFSWIQISNYEDEFLKFIGGIGLFFLILDMIIKFKKTENKKEYLKNYLPIFILAVFMIWTFISCLCSPDIEKAFYGTEYRREGYITYLAYAGIFYCAFFIKLKSDKNFLLNIFITVALINIIMVELYSHGIFVSLFASRNITTTCFWQFNHYGYYLLLATVTSNILFITQKNKIKKIIYAILYTIFMYYLIINNTFGCYLALALSLILFMLYSLYHKKNRCISILSILIFLIITCSTPATRSITKNNLEVLGNDINTIITVIFTGNAGLEDFYSVGTDRMSLWANGIKFFLERPILGYGPENLGVMYANKDIAQDRPHNLLIQLATTSGVIGLITYITAILIILIRGLKTMKIEDSIHTTSFFAVIAYLISAMFGNSMYYTSPYFFIFLGFLMCENIDNKKE